MTDDAIDINNVSYRYRSQKNKALDNISLHIKKGEFLVIMGPSEAGKSTLVSLVNGLIPHFQIGALEGNTVVLGRNTNDFSVAQMAEVAGMVFQDFEAQLFSTNVELEVAFGPENFVVDHNEIKQRIEENLAYVGLEDYKRRSPSSLSGGQKQKLAIASVLALHPQVLVMDEPTTDLDPISKYEVFKIIQELRKRNDLTLIVVEHETEEIINSDRILFIQEGKIKKIGVSYEMLKDVDLMGTLGLMPLGIPKFFKLLNSMNVPITPQDACLEFIKSGLKISEKKYQQLLDTENTRRSKHTEPIITTKNLEFSYPGKIKALDNVNIEVFKGEIIGLVGQNGSGKTTLAKHFNGLLFPTKGDVFVDGKSTREQGVYKLGQKIGYVFQNPDHQIFSETVFDEVAFSPRLRKLSEIQVRKQVHKALDAVSLRQFEKEDPFSLTKSGRQRVAVASILANNPEVIILDEPTTGMDFSEQKNIMEMIRELNENGSTIIIITHHMWVVTEYTSRVFVMKDSKVILEGPTRSVFSKEEILHSAFLRPPHFVQFSNKLGKTFFTPEEMIGCIDTEAPL
jgi:energy-coupling factor transport system ATP-binding protein